MLAVVRRLLGLGASTPVSAPVRARGPFEDLREQIRRDVANGFLDEDAILANAQDLIDEYAEDMDADLVRREALMMLYEALADHLQEEKGWTDATDCDRLDAAFAAMEKDGLIARQNFSWCTEAGVAAIWDEVRAAQADGRPTRGYTFFHAQDSEGAVDGHGLFLNYGACGPGEAAAVAIGHEVVAHLAAQGLKPEWDGSLSRRIGVPIQWRKRRASEGGAARQA
jgi:hypothetical protein